MTPLLNDSLSAVADVQKTFGSHGELIIKLRPDAPEEIDVKEPVFVMIDGLPVPFYFKSFEARGNHRAQVIFDDMESQKLADDLVGKTLLLPDSEPSSADSENDLTGYKVHDKHYGEIGVVSGFMDIPANPCLQIDYNGRKLLVPFHAAIVIKINNRRRTLETLLPEGLLEL